MKKILLILTLVIWSVWILSAMPPHPDNFKDSENHRMLPRLVDRLSSDFQKGLNRSANSFPLTGDTKVLVLLVGFSDESLDSTSNSDFYDGLFTDGPNGNGMSWRRYYLDMSNNLLNLQFDVYDIGDIAYGDYQYYGQNIDNNGDGVFEDAHPGELVARAVAQGNDSAGQDINYAQYDNDGDGYVDAVIVIHQGQGEEFDVSIADNIWSHRWGLSSANQLNNNGDGWDDFADVTSFNNGILEYDGVRINDYAIQPEYLENAGDSTIGVFVHEFGHILGLPDLYDYSYESDGIGDWGLMSFGAWGGDNGDMPTPLSAWSRMQLGWLTAETANPAKIPVYAGFPSNTALFILFILSSISVLSIYIQKLRKKPVRKMFFIQIITVSLILFSTCGDKGSKIIKTLADVETSYEAVAIDIGAGEYILAENKVQTQGTWSSSLPGSGLVLYHIDKNLISSRGFGFNDYSLAGAQLGVKVIEADGMGNLLDPDDSDAGSVSDPFYEDNVNSLSGYINNAGVETTFEISDIGSIASTINFSLFFFD